MVERQAIEWYALDGLGGTSGSFARYFEDDLDEHDTEDMPA